MYIPTSLGGDGVQFIRDGGDGVQFIRDGGDGVQFIRDVGDAVQFIRDGGIRCSVYSRRGCPSFGGTDRDYLGMKQHPGETPLYVDGQGLASCPGSAGGLASCLKPLNMGGPKIILAGLHVILLADALTALTTAAIAAAAT